MMDNFEQEMKNLMATFDKEPEKNTWPKILRGLKTNYGGISRLNLFLPVAAAFLVLCVGSVSLFKEKINKKPTLGAKIAMDTLMFMAGEGAFRTYCATCHASDLITIASGPALAGVTKRRSKDWLYDFTRNSQRMIRLEDSLALILWHEWQPAVMSNFLNVTDGYLDTLYYFIEKASEQSSYEDLSHFERGEVLFDQHCSSCHTMAESTEEVGQSLVASTETYPKKWLVKFTKDTELVLAESDNPYSIAYMEKNDTLIAPHKTDASLKEVSTIIDYIAMSAN